MALKNGNPYLAKARRERAEEAWSRIVFLAGLGIGKTSRPEREQCVTEIEQAMDDMADYVVGSALA